MKAMRASLAVLGVLAVLGFLLSFALEASFSSRAKLIQIIELRPELLKRGGQGYVPVSSAQLGILDDRLAFLPGFGDQGQYLVDAAVLRQHREYPIEMRSVGTMAWIARAGCVFAAVACLLGYALMPSVGRAPGP